MQTCLQHPDLKGSSQLTLFNLGFHNQLLMRNYLNEYPAHTSFPKIISFSFNPPLL